jgi:two-component system sensor histidine kinase CpxA
MKTLRFRILLIFTVVFLCSSFATWRIAKYIDRLITHDFFDNSMKLELQQARRAYETGGSAALRDTIAELDTTLHGNRFLLDARGRDVLTGTDRSDMLQAESLPDGRLLKFKDRFIVAKASADGKYHLAAIAPPPLSTTKAFVPYFLLLTLAIALLGWLLSFSIVSPLHRVAAVVDHFGKGDLSARVRSKRTDEIGELARSFDSMADRIQTLLTAERRLLQDISHELRSPLARLSFAAELMKGATNPDEALDRMRHEVFRLSQLIDNLLEVTRMEGDPSSREMQRFSFAALMQDVLSDCAFEAEARSIKIASRVSGPLDMQGDPELIRRAIENVLRNAIRFSPEQSSIQTQVEHDAHSITVAVRDSGPGVPENLLTGIFDPFVRADESRDTSAGGGVGLGLSIARRAVLLHHGAITAKNLNPGLQVTIELPSGMLTRVK